MAKKTETKASSSRARGVIDKFKTHPLWRLETALVSGAIAAGLLSGFLAKRHEEDQKEKLERLYRTEAVLVAAKDLPAGSILDESNVKASSYLASNVSKNFVDTQSRAMVLGHKISVDVMEGDPILLSAVQGAGEAKGIAEKIPPGKRLFTLTIDSKSAGYGFVNPNDHVDIIAHLDLPGRGLTSFTILEDITLVSVGARSVINDGVRSSGTDVSFFVTPKEFELLSFAQKRGNFSLSLRNPKDLGKIARDEEDAVGIDIDKFLDHSIISKASGGGALEVTVEGTTSKKQAPTGGKDRS